MTVFNIKYLKCNNKDFKCIELNNKIDLRLLTPLIFDVFLNNRGFKYRIGYYHDGNVTGFIHLTKEWLNAWYTACENKHYIWQSMAFTPYLNIYTIVKIETKRIDNYNKLKEFLRDFFKDKY